MVCKPMEGVNGQVESGCETGKYGEEIRRGSAAKKFGEEESNE